jgi:hypothetical protein
MPDAPAGEIAREQDFDARLQALDLGLFEQVGPPGWAGDAASLLAVHAGCREVYGDFAYLEIGSYLGASLQSFVADPHCTAIVSIDPRPAAVADDRGLTAYYEENSTANMIAHLERVPGADLRKLEAIEADAGDVEPARLPARPRLCFIDGEHTYEAALRDARFCRDVLADDGAILFHDRAVVARAISAFVADLERERRPFFTYALPSALFVVELGPAQLLASRAIASRLSPLARRFWSAANRPPAAKKIGLALRAEARARKTTPRWLKRLLVATVLRGSGRGSSEADAHRSQDGLSREQPA